MKTTAEASSTEPAEDPNADLLLDHEYDGIREYDNPMPRWWVWIFWGSFYFSIAYFFHFHISGNGQTVAEDHQQAVALAREREAQQSLAAGISEQTLSELMAKTDVMNDASSTFIKKCAECHGNQGEGKIGPNLTDDYWIHGDASLMAIYQLVAEGVQTKGMPPWKRQMRPIELAKVAAFVGTLRGKNLDGPKGKEGKLVKPPGLDEAVQPSEGNTPSKPN